MVEKQRTGAHTHILARLRFSSGAFLKLRANPHKVCHLFLHCFVCIHWRKAIPRRQTAEIRAQLWANRATKDVRQAAQTRWNGQPSMLSSMIARLLCATAPRRTQVSSKNIRKAPGSQITKEHRSTCTNSLTKRLGLLGAGVENAEAHLHWPSPREAQRGHPSLSRES